MKVENKLEAYSYMSYLSEAIKERKEFKYALSTN